LKVKITDTVAIGGFELQKYTRLPKHLGKYANALDDVWGRYKELLESTDISLLGSKIEELRTQELFTHGSINSKLIDDIGRFTGLIYGVQWDELLNKELAAERLKCLIEHNLSAPGVLRTLPMFCAVRLNNSKRLVDDENALPSSWIFDVWNDFGNTKMDPIHEAYQVVSIVVENDFTIKVENKKGKSYLSYFDSMITRNSLIGLAYIIEQLDDESSIQTGISTFLELKNKCYREMIIPDAIQRFDFSGRFKLRISKTHITFFMHDELRKKILDWVDEKRINLNDNVIRLNCSRP